MKNIKLVKLNASIISELKGVSPAFQRRIERNILKKYKALPAKAKEVYIKTIKKELNNYAMQMDAQKIANFIKQRHEREERIRKERARQKGKKKESRRSDSKPKQKGK